jgi:hypothetical protein
VPAKKAHPASAAIRRSASFQSTVSNAKTIRRILACDGFLRTTLGKSLGVCGDRLIGQLLRLLYFARLYLDINVN